MCGGVLANDDQAFRATLCALAHVCCLWLLMQVTADIEVLCSVGRFCLAKSAVKCIRLAAEEVGMTDVVACSS